MTPPAPEVTVVVPCFNAERWLAEAVASARDQAGVAVEVIVVDDGSSDGSVDVLRGFGAAIRWESGPNRGACAARNRGLELARAPWVLFLDADDRLGAGVLAPLLARARAGGSELAIAPCADVDAAAATPPRPRPRPRLAPREAFLSDWLFGRWLPPCALLWRREFLLALGGWRADLRRHQDTELVLRAVLGGVCPVASDVATTHYRVHGGDDRISRDTSAAALLAMLDVKRLFLEQLARSDVDAAALRPAFDWSTHELERLAARLGRPRVRAAVAAFRRECGFSGYPGTVRHRLACRLLGLETKERLTAWARRCGRPVLGGPR
jgi:glycosyltransferase involved in cell wall biosynthesis